MARIESKIHNDQTEKTDNKHVDDFNDQASEQVIENTEEKTQTEINSEENDSNNESYWHRPISLKGFKKKLNEGFVVKWVTSASP